MDDVDKGVLVVNAFGDIQVANRKLHAIFGYKKGTSERPSHVAVGHLATWPQDMLSHIGAPQHAMLLSTVS